MIHAETLAYMDTEPTQRETIGKIVEAEVSRNGWTGIQAAVEMQIGRQTLYRLYAGDPTISKVVFRKVERALSLPRFLFDYFLAGDREAILALDFDPDLKRLLLVRSELVKPTRRRSRQSGT